MSERFDAIVIGAGPAGEVAASRLRATRSPASPSSREVAFGLHSPGVDSIPDPRLAEVGLKVPSRGREERIRFEKQWRAEWGEFRYEVEELIDLGNRVLLIGRMIGSGSSSGAAFDNDWADLFTISGGQVVCEQVIFDRSKALEAAGLRSKQDCAASPEMELGGLEPPTSCCEAGRS